MSNESKPQAREFCDKCKDPVEWNKLIWNISEVKGYKTKTLHCHCGHEMFRAVPVSKDKLKLWNLIKEMF